MDDRELFARIERLVDEEDRLREQEAAGEAADDAGRRLRELEVALDQCWDLLRQRRARRDAGQDPDATTVRPASVVEQYDQ